MCAHELLQLSSVGQHTSEMNVSAASKDQDCHSKIRPELILEGCSKIRHDQTSEGFAVKLFMIQRVLCMITLYTVVASLSVDYPMPSSEDTVFCVAEICHNLHQRMGNARTSGLPLCRRLTKTAWGRSKAIDVRGWGYETTVP